MKSFSLHSAIRNITGHFYINGDWRIDAPRAMHFAGTTFHYERRPDGVGFLFSPEIIRCKGPITEPLFLVVRK